MSTRTQPVARIVIIGNEVLSGKVRDANTPFLLKRLRQLGVRCAGVEVVPDEPDVIAGAVRVAAANADWVFTSGGVGPTHDDVTMYSIALAFDVPVEENPDMAAFLRSHPTRGDQPERLRMAQLPQGASVDLSGRFPQVRMENVWIFPGVPRLLQNKFERVAAQLGGVPMHCSGVYSTLSESDLALRLEAIVTTHPTVEVGSYPQWLDSGYRVLLTLESLDPSSLASARTDLVDSLGPDAVLDVVVDYHPEDQP